MAIPDRFGPSDAATVSGVRFYAGIGSNVSAPTNVDPSTLTNQIGVAQLSTDSTQLYLVYGGSSAQTTIALGSTNFPGNSTSVLFELAIFSPSATASTYYVQVTNLNTGAVYTNTLSGSSSVVPQAGTLLAPRIWRTNNATALACAYDNAGLYLSPEC